MKILMISTDRTIFKEGSEARSRMVEYGSLVDELHIIIFTRQHTTNNIQPTTQKISENIWMYPTYSRTRWFYIVGAYKIAKSIISRQSSVISRWLVTCQDPFECGLAGWLTARHHKVPLQLQIHTDFLSPYFIRESFLNAIRVRIAKFLLPRASCVRVVSERIKRSLSNVKCQMSNVSVLPVFVDTEKIRSTPIKTDLHKKYPQFDYIALIASRLTKEKNIDMAIEAMKEIVKKHPRAGLVIVGNGPERANYELRITNDELEKNVIIEEWTDDIISYYKTADVFLLTSNYEGYGRTIIEAQAAGLLVVMTDVGVAGEVIRNGVNGLVVPVGDVAAFTDALALVREKKTVLKADLLMVLYPKEYYLTEYVAAWQACVTPVV